MNNNKIKHSLLILGICVISCTFILIGTSYAYISLEQGGQKNTVQVGNLTIGYNDNGNRLNLVSAYPVSDAVGQGSTGYAFTVSNTGTVPMRYNIQILNDQATINSEGCSGKLLSFSNIKYSLNGGSPVILANVGNNYTISSGRYLGAGAAENLNIRMWITDTSGNEILGKHYHGKISITGTQA
ncbi:MAG: hypothetical protein RSB99_03495 [Bacilli bacterium]